MGIENAFGQFSPDKDLSAQEAIKATGRKRALELERIRKEAEESLAKAIKSNTSENERREAERAGQERDDQRLAA